MSTPSPFTLFVYSGCCKLLSAFKYSDSCWPDRALQNPKSIYERHGCACMSNLTQNLLHSILKAIPLSKCHPSQHQASWAPSSPWMHGPSQWKSGCTRPWSQSSARQRLPIRRRKAKLMQSCQRRCVGSEIIIIIWWNSRRNSTRSHSPWRCSVGAKKKATKSCLLGYILGLVLCIRLCIRLVMSWWSDLLCLWRRLFCWGLWLRRRRCFF